MNVKRKTLSWREVFRRGFAPQLTDAGLAALRDALAADDGRLLQGATTVPPPLQCVTDWPVEGACPVSFACWQGGGGLEKVGEVEEAFQECCFACGRVMGEAAACRFFLNWFDETPRGVAVPALLAEVEAELRERDHTEGGADAGND